MYSCILHGWSSSHDSCPKCSNITHTTSDSTSDSIIKDEKPFEKEYLPDSYVQEVESLQKKLNESMAVIDNLREQIKHYKLIIEFIKQNTKDLKLLDALDLSIHD